MLYKKAYAVVKRVMLNENCILVRVTEGNGVVPDNALLLLNLHWRCGYGHTGCRGFDFQPGVVVKVYEHPKRTHLKFRRVGS